MYESHNMVTSDAVESLKTKPYCDGSHWMYSQQDLQFQKIWELGGF